MHSTHSDGEFSPEGLVQIAKRNGVGILALTDHDTFSGIPEFLEAAEKEDIVAFPGIEITVSYHDFNLHLLSYFKSLDSIQPDLTRRVETMKQAREDRMHELIALINEVVPERFQGSIEFDNVKRASEGVLARPHLAREMVRLGIVSSTNEAFDQYLVQYNVEKENLKVEEALQMVRQSQGVPVVAHPGERTYSLCNPDKGRSYEDVPEKVEELIPRRTISRASEGVLARPHLAREMVRLGIVSSTNEAFDKYLVQYNVEKENLQVAEAIQMVRQSRGVPVVAHPGERTYSLCNPDKGRSYEDVPEKVEELMAMGLLGLECVYPYHERIGKVEFYQSLTERYGLIATGSRDFHGFTTYQQPQLLGTTAMDDSFLKRFEEVWG